MTNKDHIEQFISQMMANAAISREQAANELMYEGIRVNGMADAFDMAASLAERVLLPEVTDA